MVRSALSAEPRRSGCSARLRRGLLEDLQVTGAHVESSGLDPMADLIRAQRLAVALAEAKGLNPDEPRHLTRSVLLS